uniref:Prostate-associated microseminoprotein n=1 Tax=Salvator merianae TaxID=96440 RepID=A0A8D0E4D0_SALMN
MAASWRPRHTCLLLLCLLSRVPGPAGLCYFHAQAPCLYEGKPFGPGESWQGDNCSKCFCLQPLGVGCCDMMHHPVDFPDWCEVRFDTQACQVSLVQKARPSLPCLNKLKHSWGTGDTTEEPTASLGRHSLGGRH